MFLLVLDKDPLKSAQLVPDKLKFKQLIELCQLICSAGISDIYKPIKQGKSLQEWVKKHPEYIAIYMWSLKDYCKNNVRLKYKTVFDIEQIYFDLYYLCKDRVKMIKEPTTTAIFRYSKDYECFTKHPTNTELPIDECIKEYKKYIEWKMLNGVRGYV